MTNWESADKCVKKEILHPGDFSNKPRELSSCSVNVESALIEETAYENKSMSDIFFSDIINEIGKKSFTIGDACSRVDRCIERAIQTMSINEKSLIIIRVPVDCKSTNDLVTLLVKITLENFDIQKPIWEWSTIEKYENALKHKEKGVQLFRDKRYIDAFYKFSKACKVLITLESLEEDDPHIQNVCNLKYILYNNMAECQLMKENYEHALSLCNKVLIKEQNNIKALYRRGVAYGSLKNYEQAVNDLKIVIQMEPSDKRAQEKFNVYSKKWRTSVERYHNMVRKMFKA